MGRPAGFANDEAIRLRLATRREELTTRRRRVDRDLGRQNEPLVADFSDQATQVQNDEVLEAIGDSASRELEAIDAALERIASGRFGVCTDCGQQIERARLEAVPYAVRCSRCAV
ncbi:MAG TPA: TraR/DksA family transcriptional regulator [Povalibacter sp.]|uniref:TraR/DksA family transcriptional regulator n=1 Tax=Povalibacter sp. TaxID=1962978 RepID=UPI002C5F2F51|nr:TraR/DksA family transcriptional regulator [Povalibacter sp.]HMN46359.1 TraR/DksA family transcriptional regulator [Povalibacter sp.]